MLKLGLIGAGEIYSSYKTAIEQLPGVRISAVADPRFTRQNPTENAEATTFRDPYEMLKEDLDGVVILTPNNLHFEFARAAVQQRIPVLCEKPLTTSLVDAEALINEAKATQTLLAVAMHCRYRPEIKYLHEHIRGHVVHFEQVYHEIWMSSRPWYFDPYKSGGGVLLDVGINQLDWIAPLLEGLSCKSASAQLDNHQVEVACQVQWTYLAGTGKTDLSWKAREETKWSKIKTSTGDHYELDHRTHQIYVNGDLKKLPPCQEYHDVITAFREDLLQGHLNKGQEGYARLVLLREVYQKAGLPFLTESYSQQLANTI